MKTNNIIKNDDAIEGELISAEDFVSFEAQDSVKMQARMIEESRKAYYKGMGGLTEEEIEERNKLTAPLLRGMTQQELGELNCRNYFSRE